MGDDFVISGKMLKDALISAALTLSEMKKQVDELNVYPVPDGDTGTNMSLTLANAMNALSSVSDEADVSEVASAAASAMLRGARGNSGVITSLLFRGFSKGLAGKKEAGCDDMANALEIGVEAAYKSVMKPAEGTILTVARVASEKARESSFMTNDPVSLWNDVCIAAEDALAKTPEQLPILKKAGVVDAGGKGLVIIFNEMLRAFRGEPRTVSAEPKVVSDGKYSFSVEDDETLEITFGYCTEFIVNVTDTAKKTAELREYLESIGDCVVVVDDEDIIKVHVHTDHPGLAFEKGLEYGSLCNMKVDNMRLQREKKAAAVKVSNEKPVPAAPEKQFGFVAVANGSGIEAMFTDLGADAIVRGGQTMNPSADDILRAVYSVPAETVFILPNNKNIIMAAEQAMKLSEKTICVLRTTSVPQGMSAMMNFDPDSDFDTNRMNMTLAAEKVQSGLVTFAARDSSFSGHEIKSGDILALENGRLSFIDRDVTRAAYKLTRKLMKNLKKNAGFVTVMYGADVSEDKAAELENIMRSKLGSVDVNFVRGGQPVYYYIVSVEPNG
ncbi:MAG: DAK2 domain-containing protein [Huintestinicola sp.]|uniref:DAK2 domain-containing protein n=1 Tax=Huintestinicola sp. TaxID=2981661 RepID=UPI003F0E0882